MRQLPPLAHRCRQAADALRSSLPSSPWPSPRGFDVDELAAKVREIAGILRPATTVAAPPTIRKRLEARNRTYRSMLVS